MKNKKNKTAKNTGGIIPKINLKPETIHWVMAIIFFVLSMFFVLASVNNGGVVGKIIYEDLGYLFGIGYFLFPTLFLILGISYSREVQTNFALVKIFGSLLFVISGLGIIDIIVFDKGGVVGKIISSPLIKLFDYSASIIFLSALIIISILVIFDTTPNWEWLSFWKKFRKEKSENKTEVEETKIEKEIENKKISNNNNDEENKKGKNKKWSLFGKKNPENFDEEMETTHIKKSFKKNAVAIPINLLEKDRGKPGVGDIKANSNIIKRTLQNFGIIVEMDEISIGPSVTRYALKPAEGVKLSRIVGLQNDLALALAAHPIRIEAPIPGKSLVGIEIPNSTRSTVGLASLISSKEYSGSPKPLLMALGRGISGFPEFADLGKMPHLLIAGSTGSGKSVTIHTLINSLIYRNAPENMRFIMVDPKRVELTLYNGIPHLLSPVITGAKKAIMALKWAAKEMERRYDILQEKKVRDIQSYHANIVKPLISRKELTEDTDTMPYIVIVIDELADIMQSYPRELEGAIVRLAQMSRATGIHLILSTQRPSVNVITGLIKANIPARVALQVSSQVDSRTILDMSGAETLLGAGDMLYLSSDMSKPKRLQSAFISEKEVKNIVSYLKKNYVESLPEDFELGADNNGHGGIEEALDGNFEDDDDLFEEAREIVIEAGKASTSYLQRKLRIGYARAARLMDILEERGVVGPPDGAKPRDVLVKSDEGYGEE